MITHAACLKVMLIDLSPNAASIGYKCMYMWACRFLWSIGSSPNDTDVMDWVQFEHYEKWACVDIALNHSETYYNTIAAYNKALNSRRTEKVSDGSTLPIFTASNISMIL